MLKCVKTPTNLGRQAIGSCFFSWQIETLAKKRHSGVEWRSCVDVNIFIKTPPFHSASASSPSWYGKAVRNKWDLITFSLYPLWRVFITISSGGGNCLFTKANTGGKKKKGNLFSSLRSGTGTEGRRGRRSVAVSPFKHLSFRHQ